MSHDATEYRAALAKLFHEWFDGPECSFRGWLAYASEHGYDAGAAERCWDEQASPF